MSIVNQSWGQNSRNDVENHFGTVGDSPQDILRDMTAAYQPFWDKAHAGQKTWMDAMADAGRQYSFIQIISAGNDSHGANPDTNANLPYFKPDLESKWLSITGYDESGAQVYNRCGTSKWWCVMGFPAFRPQDRKARSSPTPTAPRRPPPAFPAPWPW